MTDNAKPPCELAEAAGSALWVCLGCRQRVPVAHVTYTEYHDERYGGCGGKCVDAETAKKSDPRNKAVELLIHGLTTDGGHHKQWYLEQVFRALCEDAYVDKARLEFQWEEGIAP